MNGNNILDANYSNTIATLNMQADTTASFLIGTPVMLKDDGTVAVSNGSSVFGVSATNFLPKKDEVLGSSAPFFETGELRVVKIGAQPLQPIQTGSATTGYTTVFPYVETETWKANDVVKVSAAGKWSKAGISTISATVIKPFDANNKTAIIWVNI